MSICCQLTLQRPRFDLEVDLTLPGSGVTIIFGRSGCGKTSLLRSIAGLETAAVGEVTVCGQSWQSAGQKLGVHQRPLGYVFQEASLLPHLSVQQHLLFGYRRLSRDQRRIEADEVIALMGLEALLSQYPPALSGGQRQRVAIASALLTSPRLLLMDEPMAALDQTSKAEILPYIAALKVRLGLPVIYVTHSTEEALRLGDHLVVMDQGRVVAEGALPEVIQSGRLPGLGDEGVLNLLLAQPGRSDLAIAGLFPVSLAGQTLWLTQQQMADYRMIPKEPLRLQIPAKGLVLSRTEQADPSVLNQLQTRLVSLQPDPDPAFCRAELALSPLADNPVLIARLPCVLANQLQLTPGCSVRVFISQIRLLG